MPPQVKSRFFFKYEYSQDFEITRKTTWQVPFPSVVYQFKLLPNLISQTKG